MSATFEAGHALGHFKKMDEVERLHKQLVDASDALNASRHELENEKQTLKNLTRQSDLNLQKCEEAASRLSAVREEIDAVQLQLKKIDLSSAICKEKTKTLMTKLKVVEACAVRVVDMFETRSAGLRRCVATLVRPCVSEHFKDLASVSKKMRDIRNERKARRERRTVKLKEQKKFLLDQKISLNKEIALLKQRNKHFGL